MLKPLLNNLELSRLLVAGLLALFTSLCLFATWLVVFEQADKIAERFLAQYFLISLVSFIIGALYAMLKKWRQSRLF